MTSLNRMCILYVAIYGVFTSPKYLLVRVLGCASPHSHRRLDYTTGQPLSKLIALTPNCFCPCPYPIRVSNIVVVQHRAQRRISENALPTRPVHEAMALQHRRATAFCALFAALIDLCMCVSGRDSYL